MITRRLAALLLSVVLAGPVQLLAASVRARVHVTRSIAPGVIEVELLPPPYTSDQIGIEVVAYCDGERVSSEWRQLDDRTQLPLAPVIWRDLPGCLYTIVVVLQGSRGPLAYSAPMQARIVCLSCDQETDNADFP